MENKEIGNILYTIDITHEKLDELFNTALDNALSSNEKMETNGVEVEMCKVGDASVYLKGKEMILDLPLDVHVRRKAGLFTVEGRGQIALEIRIDYDITSNLKLKCKSKIENHNWLSKPKLEIGALSIPIETLLNLVINHQESIITGKIDNALNNAPDFGALLLNQIRQAETKINESLPFEANLGIHIETIYILPPTRSDEGVQINGAVDVYIDTIASNKKVPKINWLDEMASDTPMHASFGINYSDIAQLIQEKASGMDISGQKVVLSNVQVSYTDSLQILSEIESPLTGAVEVFGEPLFEMSEGKLNVENFDVKVKPNNIIYKMTAPIANTFIRKKAEQFLPVPVQELLNTSLEKIPATQHTPYGAIELSFDGITLQDLNFEADRLRIDSTVSTMNIHANIA